MLLQFVAPILVPFGKIRWVKLNLFGRLEKKELKKKKKIGQHWVAEG